MLGAHKKSPAGERRGFECTVSGTTGSQRRMDHGKSGNRITG